MGVAADYVGMDPGNYNLAIYQGATFKKLFTWSDNAGPVNLTGCVSRMKARDRGQSIPSAGVQAPALDVVVISLVDGAGLALGGVAGTITITIADEATALLASGTYFYDLEIETVAGDVIRFLNGEIIVYGEQTR